MMTTLFSRDEEALNLEPIEEVVGKTKSKKRKRKLIVDQEKILLNDAIKQQISNDEDIIKTAVVAPPTKTRSVHFSTLFLSLRVHLSVCVFVRACARAFLATLGVRVRVHACVWYQLKCMCGIN